MEYKIYGDKIDPMGRGGTTANRSNVLLATEETYDNAIDTASKILRENRCNYFKVTNVRIKLPYPNSTISDSTNYSF